MSPNAGCGVSTNEYSYAHGVQINFGDLTPYLAYEEQYPPPPTPHHLPLLLVVGTVVLTYIYPHHTSYIALHPRPTSTEMPTCSTLLSLRVDGRRA
jgi:hypothetical protein